MTQPRYTHENRPYRSDEELEYMNTYFNTYSHLFDDLPMLSVLDIVTETRTDLAFNSTPPRPRERPTREFINCGVCGAEIEPSINPACNQCMKRVERGNYSVADIAQIVLNSIYMGKFWRKCDDSTD